MASKTVTEEKESGDRAVREKFKMISLSIEDDTGMCHDLETDSGATMPGENTESSLLQKDGASLLQKDGTASTSSDEPHDGQTYSEVDVPPKRDNLTVGHTGATSISSTSAVGTIGQSTNESSVVSGFTPQPSSVITGVTSEITTSKPSSPAILTAASLDTDSPMSVSTCVPASLLLDSQNKDSGSSCESTPDMPASNVTPPSTEASVMIASLIPSEEKTRRLRLLSLIVDGGGLVLKHQFDEKFPPPNLKSGLQNEKVQRRIKLLTDKNTIRKNQREKLYPLSGDPCSSTFDITLLSCLLRNICGLADPCDPVWSTDPPSHDTSIEADIYRLRTYRNELSHLPRLAMADQDFTQKWREIEPVLLRLGSNTQSLKVSIDAIKSNSLDPAMESRLQEVIADWKQYDEILEAKIADIKAQQIKHKSDLQNLKDEMEKVKEKLQSASESKKAQDNEGLTETENPVQTEFVPLKNAQMRNTPSFDMSQQPSTMTDILLLHTDEDEEDAMAYKKHLEEEVDLPQDLTVDLFGGICPGKSYFAIMDSVPGTYKLVLLYMTRTFVKNRCTGFFHDMILTYKLEQNEDILPVQVHVTKELPTDDLKYKVTKPLKYYNFLSDSPNLKKLYIDSVKQLVAQIRTHVQTQ